MTLQDVIDKHSNLIGKTYNGRNYHAIQNIIRSIDNVFPLYHSSSSLNEKEVAEFREFFNFGWANLLRYYYNDIEIDIHEPFPLMTDELTQWAYSNIVYSGKIEFCKQLIQYEKAGLIKITQPRKNEFTFNYQIENSGIERFDVGSYNFYKQKIVERITDEELYILENLIQDLLLILKNLASKSFENEVRLRLEKHCDSTDPIKLVLELEKNLNK